LLVEIVRAEGKRDFGVDRLAALASPDGVPDDVDVRARALLGLGRVGGDNDRAVAVLVGALRQPDARIRRAAARALGIAGAEQAQGALIDRYQREPDRDTRAVIVEALGRVGDAVALPLLTAALTDTLSGTELAEHAAVAMGRLGRRQKPLDDRARRALIAAARPQRSALRHAVAFALVREHLAEQGDASSALADDDDIVATLELLARDPDPEVRALAITALARRRPGSQAIGAALGDADWRVRVAAARGLSGAHASADQRARLAVHLVREWADFLDRDMRGPRVHVLTEGLRGLAGGAAPGAAIRDAAASLHRSAEVFVDRTTRELEGGPRLAASTIHCLAASVRVRAGAGIDVAEQCGGALAGGMPEHERALLLARLIADGHGGDDGQRLARLRALFGHRDGRVRAAAVAVLADVVSSPDSPELLIRGALDMLAQGLGDAAIEVAGTAAEAMRTLAGNPALAGRVASLAAGPLLASASAWQDDLELAMTLMAALAAARVAQAAPLCRRAHRHANRSMRASGRDCLKALARPDPGPDGDAHLGASDPGPGRAAAAMALPPVDPADVVGKKLVLTMVTSKGEVAVALDSEAAPWHVASLLHLVEQGFYRDLPWHRVVPDFVVQGGDPRGSGWGGPDFVIPAEPGSGQFVRGTVGIADAGLDTGGSQWFIMHSRAPHLDGRYTIIGQVIRGQDVIDALVVGDRIITATIAPGR
jgi:cyclophilin family peptidyl-prolyl cis-trans isomerase/HEAT repeat protein